MNKNSTYYFIVFLLLVCAAAVAQTPFGKPNVTKYKFGPNDERHVDMNDADVCVEAGRFYYEQAFKAGSLEEASVLLNQSITLFQHALELRMKNGLPSEQAVIRNHLADAFMAAAKLFPNDIQTATAYRRKAAEQIESIIMVGEPVNDRNRGVVAEGAYHLTKILLAQNDDQKAVAAAEIAWTNGWKEWDAGVVNRLNDSLRSGAVTSSQLPPPTKRSTAASIVLFPLNVLPDMLVEGVCNGYKQSVRSLGWFQSSHSILGFSVVVGAPLFFVGGMVGGVQEAWRGYPFWNTRSIRMTQGREYPSIAFVNEW